MEEEKEEEGWRRKMDKGGKNWRRKDGKRGCAIQLERNNKKVKKEIEKESWIDGVKR